MSQQPYVPTSAEPPTSVGDGVADVETASPSPEAVRPDAHLAPQEAPPLDGAEKPAGHQHSALWASVDAYVARCRDHLRKSPHTVRAYAGDLGALAEHLTQWGVESVEQMTGEQLRRHVHLLAESGQAKSSLARRISAIRSWCVYLVQTGELESNPAAVLRAPKRPRTLPTVPSGQRMAAVLEATHERAETDDPVALRDAAVLELLYASGVRISELVGLDLPDVQLPERLLRVRGKGDKERTVPFGAPAADAVAVYLQRGRPRLVGDKTPQAVFLGARGGRLDPRRVRELLQSVGAQIAPGRPIGPHGLRHAAATHMLDGGADLRSVQELLGHATLSSTQVYTHVSVDRLRVTYDHSHPRA